MSHLIENKDEKRALGTAAVMPSGVREYMRHALSPDCEVRLYVSGKITGRELRKLRHLIFMSEVWEAETQQDRPSGADKVENG